MSTYNGERFLRAQLDSLFLHQGPDIRLHVRDDGSSDGTRDIVRWYMSKRSAISLETGANIGPAQSFLRLLQAAQPEQDAYLFCDQDDLWNPEKIPVAVAALRAVGPGTPAMYFSRVAYIDTSDAYLGMSRIPTNLGLGNAIVENVAQGCTIALNSAAREVICKARPEHLIMHDWWCYLVMSVFGRLLYDPTPHINYRLHGANATVTRPTRLAQFMADVRRRVFYSYNTQMRSLQAAEFWRLYGELILDDSARGLISDFLAGKTSTAKRLRLAAGKRLKVNNHLYGPIHRLSILANSY
jgi:glycosyltransferase involved in cell wall biosynthesis